MEFPIRVPVYLSPEETIRTQSGERVSASFFAPYDKNVEPFIRIATGDYFGDKRKRGKDNALTSILFSFAHEVIHYEQWLADRELCEKEAVRGAGKLLRLYRKAVARP